MLVIKKYQSADYIIINNKNYSIFDIVHNVNEKSFNKIKVKWSSKKIIKDKIFKLKKLKNWKPKYSNLNNVINTILK